MVDVITDPKIVDEILERGTIVEVLPKKDAFRDRLLSGKRMRLYFGCDATATTLHLSHAKNFMLMEKFRKLWHEVIILFGDFTARIGDPSGKSSTRNQLSREDVLANVKVWKELIRPLMDFDNKENPPIIKYNNDWLAKLTFEEVIWLAGNFTVQQMLERDMFEKRLNEKKPIYLHEFLYPLMQGFDSVSMDVDVEICGTDQTFNALAGRTLLRKLKNKEKIVVVLTLMEDPITGDMMSKSKGTGIFLHVSSNDMYGQVMSQTDQMIPILLRHCTSLPLDEIDQLSKLDNPRDAKMRLAFEVTKIFHWDEKSNLAQQHFINTIQQKQIPDDIKEYKVSEKQVNLIDIIFESGMVASKWEAKRALAQGGVKIDGKPATNNQIDIPNEGVVLQKGKRHFLRIVTK